MARLAAEVMFNSNSDEIKKSIVLDEWGSIVFSDADLLRLALAVGVYIVFVK